MPAVRVVITVFAAGLALAAPAHADEQFGVDLSGTGIYPSDYATLEAWGESACGMSDAEALRQLPRDMGEKGITLTPQQAEMVWWSTKLNLCP